MSFESTQVRSLIRLALEEDLSQGDVTTDPSISDSHYSKGELIAKQPLVVCGVPLVTMIFEELGWKVQFQSQIEEGKEVPPKTIMAAFTGKTKDLLRAERTILNFVQRTSGVATYTRDIIRAAEGITVLDTRKTMPGFRVLDKYAVKVGGGKNHRASLGDMVLVKNNHIDAENLDGVMKKILAVKPPHLRVEIEVRDLTELRSALAYNPDIVMLDNMNDAMIADALRIVREHSSSIEVEVSGNITKSRFPALKKLGVTLVSMGALTTQAPNVDISLKITSL